MSRLWPYQTPGSSLLSTHGATHGTAGHLLLGMAGIDVPFRSIPMNGMELENWRSGPEGDARLYDVEMGHSGYIKPWQVMAEKLGNPQMETVAALSYESQNSTSEVPNVVLLRRHHLGLFVLNFESFTNSARSFPPATQLYSPQITKNIAWSCADSWIEYFDNDK